MQSISQRVLADCQNCGTLFSTHFLSASFTPIRSAYASRVSLIAAFGCFGNLFPHQHLCALSSNRFRTHCCFKTSTKPIFVSSFPSTAFLKSSKSSGGTRRLEPFEGCVEAVASEAAILMQAAAAEGVKRVFWRLIGFKGMRGGSISVPFMCGDALTESVRVMGFQYEVEYGSIGSCGFSSFVSLDIGTGKGGFTHQDVELVARQIQDI